MLNVAAMGGIYASHRALEAGEVLEAPASAPAPVALIAAPLFHVTANNCIMQAGTVAGGRFILMYKWDPVEAMRLIDAEQILSLIHI